jgi:hypothetical protein
LLEIRSQHPYLTSVLISKRATNPDAQSYAAVMVIIDADDEGSIFLDRSSFAPGLTERLN